MPTRDNSRRQIVIYLLLTFGFSSLFYFLILRAHGFHGTGGTYTLALMWCPALAGMLTLKLNGRKLSELGWKWPKSKYAAMSWFIPLLYAAIAYTIVWVSGLGGVPNREFMAQVTRLMGVHSSPAVSTLIYVLYMGSFGMVRSLSSALGEEIGWRGFLVPHLAKTFSFTNTALISGIVWSCWHYPILIWGGYNAGTPHLVRPYVLHRDGDRDFVRVCLDAPEIRKPVDGRNPAREPQPIYSVDVHAFDAQYWQDGSGSSMNSAPCYRSSQSCSRFTSGPGAASCGAALTSARQQYSIRN